MRARDSATWSLDLSVEAEMRSDDLVQPFRIDPFALRGRLVRLGPTVDRILSQHDYPEPVAAILGEAITLAVVLAGALKYDGIFTLQTKSDGPVRMIVADVSTEGAVRGYAQYDPARLGELGPPSPARPQPVSAGTDRHGLHRLYRRPGRAYRALSGHCRTRRHDACRMRSALFSPIRADPGRDQAFGRSRRRERRLARWRAHAAA